jgi:hypothetical protein
VSARRRHRAYIAIVISMALSATSAAAQSFEARVDTGRVTVGDPVPLRLVLRQYEGDALLEQVPHPDAALADGVRLLAVDSMRRVGDRLLEAHARIAFYRPGPQTVPAFAIDFRRGAVILHGTMRSPPVPIEIAATLTDGGGPTLRDIREPVQVPGPDPRIVAVIAGALALAVYAWRRRRDQPVLVPAPALAIMDVAPAAIDPFDIALARLAEIESSGRMEAGDVTGHYQTVADVLRDYLESADDIPARERTTSELRWSLPPAFLEGSTGARFDLVFGEADLVKFARRRPDHRAAAVHLEHARQLLGAWREARTLTQGAGLEADHAIR